MGWNMEEEQEKRNNGNKTLKVLVVCIVMLIIFIAVILGALYYVKMNTFIFSVDGTSKKLSNTLIKEYNGTTFYNIEELANLLGYDFHAAGEYKEYAKDNDKCYIKNENETASFFLNSDKICKLKVGDYAEPYKVFNCSYNITKINDDFYAPKDAIEVAFDATISSGNKKMTIETLPYLVKKVQKKLNPDGKEPIYESLLDQDYENQKAILYGYVILSKEKSDLYSVNSLLTQTEIISDKYKKITFIEETKEFLVTNSVDKVGIIDEDGQNIVEQIYDSIKVINTNPKLYLVGSNGKYGVVDKEGNIIVHAEYNKIGVDGATYTNIPNQYVLLDSVIPVKKGEKARFI